jgi:hypothetical protein
MENQDLPQTTTSDSLRGTGIQATQITINSDKIGPTKRNTKRNMSRASRKDHYLMLKQLSKFPLQETTGIENIDDFYQGTQFTTNNNKSFEGEEHLYIFIYIFFFLRKKKILMLIYFYLDVQWI